jgi:hypothetical protein
VGAVELNQPESLGSLEPCLRGTPRSRLSQSALRKSRTSGSSAGKLLWEVRDSNRHYSRVISQGVLSNFNWHSSSLDIELLAVGAGQSPARSMAFSYTPTRDTMAGLIP